MIIYVFVNNAILSAIFNFINIYNNSDSAEIKKMFHYKESLTEFSLKYIPVVFTHAGTCKKTRHFLSYLVLVCLFDPNLSHAE